MQISYEQAKAANERGEKVEERCICDSPAPYDNWQHLPAWANWQVQMKNGQWFFSSDKPKNYDNLAAPFGWYLGENGHGSLPSKYYPTNYSDHWEASLQERPKQ